MLFSWIIYSIYTIHFLFKLYNNYIYIVGIYFMMEEQKREREISESKIDKFICKS